MDVVEQSQPARSVRGIVPTDQAAVAIVAGIGQAAALYHRLLLVVGRTGTGKTQALVSVGRRTGAPVVNVGLHLARSLHERTGRERRLRVQALLEELLGSVGKGCDMVLLDNIEVLFDAGAATGSAALAARRVAQPNRGCRMARHTLRRHAALCCA